MNFSIKQKETLKLNVIMKLLLLFILLFLGCKSPKEKPHNSDLKIKIEGVNCVNQILKKDSVFGGIRNHASENMPLSKAINNYTNNIISLDYTKCPKKFESAFKDHVNAWLEIKKVSDKYPLLHGELHEIFTTLEKSKDSTEFNSYLKQIWDTWKKVESSK